MSPTPPPEKGGVPWTNVDPFSEDADGEATHESSSTENEAEKDDDDLKSGEVGDLQPSSSRPKIFDFGSSGGDSQSSGDRKDDNLMDRIRTHADDVGEGIIEKVRTAAQKFHLDRITATGPSKRLNPTNVRMRVRFGDEAEGGDNSSKREMEVLWRARDNRKGRNSIAVPIHRETSRIAYRPQFLSTLKEVSKNSMRVFTTFPYWDMAFWSGSTYTVGAALFVTSGAFGWAPMVNGTEFKNQTTYAVCASFLFGAIFFQIGAVMAYFEAVNEGSFHGSAMRRLLEGHEQDQKKMLDEKLHNFFGHLKPHRHRDEEEHTGTEEVIDTYAGWNTKHRRSLRPGSIYPEDKAPAPRRGGVDLGDNEGNTSAYSTWRWWPTWRALRTHHFRDIGYIACTIQLFGVTLFGVTAVVIWPFTFTSMADWQVLASYWIPQIIASLCFLISSFMFMLETQEKWWKPELGVLGWWIGAWSIVGSVGFELCAVFGTMSLYYPGTWCEYQSDLSSMWGSAGYTVGSFLQWYEAVNKHPVDELFNEPGEMKSYQVHPI